MRFLKRERCVIQFSWNWHNGVQIFLMSHLEPVCCKTTKNCSWPVTGFGNNGPLKVLNCTKLILDDHWNNLDSFRNSLVQFRTFPKPVTGQEQFFCRSLQPNGSNYFVNFLILNSSINKLYNISSNTTHSY